MSFTNPELAKSVGEETKNQSEEMIDSKELETMDADKITRFYRVPSARFKTTEQIIEYYGYRLGDKLAEGGFGKIFLATHAKTAVTVACKQMDLTKSQSKLGISRDDSKVTDMKNELYILKKMHNPYIVKLYCHFVINNLLYIFIKLANGGNFSKYVKDKGVLTEREAKMFFGQILVGIEYMHSLNIAHRDIKLDNVLLLRHPNNKLTVLITDFGLSRVICVEEGRIDLSRTICGTQAYMSPEVVANKPFNAFQADIWALGVTLFAMLNSDMPFQQEESQCQLKAQEDSQWKWSDKMAEVPTTQLNSVMKAMLQPDPDVRIRMAALVIHSWVASEYKYSKKFFEPRKAPSTGPPEVAKSAPQKP